MVDSRCSLKTFASIYPSKDAEDGGLQYWTIIVQYCKHDVPVDKVNCRVDINLHLIKET